jgi:hypothetical protein
VWERKEKVMWMGRLEGGKVEVVCEKLQGACVFSGIDINKKNRDTNLFR